MAAGDSEMSAEAEDLPETVSGSGTLGIIGGPALRTRLHLLPPSVSALPSFLCLLGRDPQWPVASGREKERVGEG